jgi:arylsulfatase A-like enzyme
VIDERAPHEDSSLPVGPQPALRHIKSPTDPPPKNPSTEERDISDKPYYIRSGGRITSAQTKKELRVRNKRRQQSLRAVDEGIGQLIDNLEAEGVLDETYILFTSDNGFFRGEHEITKGKGRHYEPATRIPLLIRGPGLKRNKINHSPVANVDLAATIADVTGASPTRTLDGRSLIPLAQNPRRIWNRPILIEEFFRKKGRPVRPQVVIAGSKTTRLPNHQAIISGYWKLVRYVTGELELYHLKRDPYEVYSLHREPEAMALRKYLLRQLARLDMCRGSGCRRQFVVPKRLTAGGLKALARVSRKGRP